MLTLFRRLRQNFITEGGRRKYLAYAIGEILLVMIGILLAMQVNNWNEQNKQRKEEHKLLKEMRAALIEDQNDIISNILEHKSAAASCEILRRLIKEDIMKLNNSINRKDKIMRQINRRIYKY